MLPKPRRLTKKRDFMRLAVKGRAVFGPYATMRIVERQGESKIAFITSTKVFKLSVDRNRAKRRMREVLRGLLPDIPPGLSLLFILKPESRDAEYARLVEEVKRMLGKVPEALLQPPKISSRGVKHKAKLQQQPKTT